jgi:hypothetical protein
MYNILNTTDSIGLYVEKLSLTCGENRPILIENSQPFKFAYK